MAAQRAMLVQWYSWLGLIGKSSSAPAVFLNRKQQAYGARVNEALMQDLNCTPNKKVVAVLKGNSCDLVKLARPWLRPPIRRSTAPHRFQHQADVAWPTTASIAVILHLAPEL